MVHSGPQGKGSQVISISMPPSSMQKTSGIFSNGDFLKLLRGKQEQEEQFILFCESLGDFLLKTQMMFLMSGTVNVFRQYLALTMIYRDQQILGSLPPKDPSLLMFKLGKPNLFKYQTLKYQIFKSESFISISAHRYTIKIIGFLMTFIYHIYIQSLTDNFINKITI